MPVNDEGQFEYPTDGWSTGKIRKRGQPTRLAMDYSRRGTPETSLADMERAAGFGMTARGGVATRAGASGVAPETIAETKAGLQVQLSQGWGAQVDWERFNRRLQKRGWKIANPETGEALPAWSELAKMTPGDLYDLVPAPINPAAGINRLVIGAEAYAGSRYMSSKEKEKRESGEHSETFGETGLGEFIGRIMGAFKDKGSVSVIDPNGEKHEIPFMEE